jgi:PAS domain S-box-containing protein
MLPQDVLLRLVLEQIGEGVIVVDDTDTVVFANRAAERIRGICASEIVGRSVLLCHPERSHERVRRALRFLRDGRGKSFTRVVADKKNDRFWENTYHPVLQSDGTYAGTAVVSQDITDRRKLEETRAMHTQELEQRIGELTRAFQELLMASMGSLVTALEAKDNYTAGHSLRVAAIATRLAEHVWGPSAQSREIDLAGKVHDIGKVGIREGVLGKPGKLSDEEFAHIKMHPVIGERILAPIDRLGPVTRIARHHHERFDGKGYPDGLKGEGIPIGARILAIADTYDAMTSARPYRDPLKPEVAAAEIRKNLESQFDPVWGRVFLELFESGSIG